MYESFLRKFDGDFQFDRKWELIEWQNVELESVNCIYSQKRYDFWIFQHPQNVKTYLGQSADYVFLLFDIAV